MFKILTILVLFGTLNCDNDVVTWNFGSFIHPKNSSVEFDLIFYSPTIPGDYPIIIFFSGLNGLVPGFFYKEFSSNLANQTRSILIIYDILKPPKLPDKEENIFAKTLNWTLENAKELFNSNSTPEIIKNKVFPDVNRVSLMGHSASGHTVVSYLNVTCGMIKSLVLIDPVDGYDPYGFVKIYITNPPKQLPFVIPTLIIRTEYDPIPVSKILPACAPSNVSNTRFYTCLQGPTWFLNFTNYGHADILDDWAIKYLSSLVCKTCEKNCVYSVYRNNVIKAINLFYDGMSKRNPIFIQALENPNNSGFFDKSLNILSVYKHNGYNVIETGPFCIHF